MIYELLKKRRSIRKFLDKPVEAWQLKQIMSCALMSPSSRGRQPWSFIVVDDPILLKALSKSKAHGSSFLKDAPVGIVVLADDTISDVWIEDASIASILVQLAAEDVGLGSCWIQIRRRQTDASLDSGEYIKTRLNVPGHLCVESIIALGYADEQRAGYEEDQLPFERVYTNSYES